MPYSLLVIVFSFHYLSVLSQNVYQLYAHSIGFLLILTCMQSLESVASSPGSPIFQHCNVEKIGEPGDEAMESVQLLTEKRVQ